MGASSYQCESCAANISALKKQLSVTTNAAEIMAAQLNQIYDIVKSTGINLEDYVETNAVRALAEAYNKQEKPTCITCNDTHMMSLRERMVMCTSCPPPCSDCRMQKTGAFCEQTPCRCRCHKPRAY